MFLDGYTDVMKGTAAVEPGWHTIRLMISDEKDGQLDSAVFIQGNSIQLEEEMCYSIVGKKTSHLLPTQVQSGMKLLYETWLLQAVVLGRSPLSVYC